MGSDMKISVNELEKQEGNIPVTQRSLIETLLNNLHDGVRVMDRDLNVMRVNQVSMKKHGLSEVPEKEKCYRVFKGRSTPCQGCPCIVSLEKGIMERAFMECSSVEGPTLNEISSFPVMEEDGSIWGVIEITRDITEQKILQDRLRKEKEKYKELFDNSENAIFIQTLEEGCLSGEIMEVNRTACERYGYTRDEFLSMSALDMAVPEHHPLLKDMLGKVWSGQKAVEQIYHRKRNGEVFPVEVEIRPCDLEGRAGIISLVRDISGRLETQDALESMERLYANLFQNNHAVMLVIDPEKGDLKDANPAACRYYGYSRKEMLRLKGWDLNALSEKDQREAMTRAKTGEQKFFQFRHRLSNGETRDVEVYTGPIEMDGKKYLYSIVHDITERILAEEAAHRLTAELLKASRTDKLTGIFNRAYFEETLLREIDKARRYQTCLSLIMFDLDNYKDINDSLGHMAGDMVLKRVAESVNANIRKSDYLVRWGGDEFMILTPMRLPSALKLAGKLRRVIEELDCGVTASFGTAELSREDTIDQLTRRVDRALYQAKSKGKNTVSTYEEPL